MKKKFLTLGLIATMCLSFVGCGGNSSADKQATSDNKVEEVTTESNQATASKWEFVQETDEFGDSVNTENKGIGYNFTGSYSYKGGSEKELTGRVLLYDNHNNENGLEDKILYFSLIENGEYPVWFDKLTTVSLKMKIDDTIETYKLSTNPDSSTLEFVDYQLGAGQPYAAERIFDVLCQENDIRCIITVNDSKYSFTIGSDGISEACLQAGIAPYEDVEIESFSNIFEAFEKKQQLPEVQTYINNNLHNYQVLTSSEIIELFTDSSWKMVSFMGGELEDSVFSKDKVSGTFLDSMVSAHPEWSSSDDRLYAYGLTEGYRVYHVEGDYYILNCSNTNIVAQKIK